MKIQFLIAITTFLFAISGQSADFGNVETSSWEDFPDAETRSWENLSRSGKGIYVMKVLGPESELYIFFRGTNRLRPISSVVEGGVSFSSLANLRLFLQLKPAEVMVFVATEKSVRDDEGIQLSFNDYELDLLGIAAGSRIERDAEQIDDGNSVKPSGDERTP